MVEGVAEGLELRLVPARAQTQCEPAAADLIDRVGHLRQKGRVAEGGAGNQWTQLDLIRCRGERS